jgi:voltage-gated potassium channel Kch
MDRGAPDSDEMAMTRQHLPVRRAVPRAFIGFGIATLVSGAFGLWEVHSARGLGHALSAVLFDVAGMFVLEHPERDPENPAFSLARVFAVCTAAFGIWYLVLGIFQQSAEQWRLGRFARRARRRRRRLVVICGLGRIGMQLVRDLTDGEYGRGTSVVAIEIDDGNPGIETARERGAVVVIGNARDAEVRLRARLDLASEIFIACGDDAANLNVAAEVVRDVDAGPPVSDRELHCYISIVSATLAKAARDNPTFSTRPGRLRLEIFSAIDNAARLLVKEELGREHAPRAGEVAHYLLFGFGTMGQAVALHAARLAHFENDRRLRMTIVDTWDDPAPSLARRRFLERHPAFCPDPDGFDLAGHVRLERPDKDRWHYRAGRPADRSWRIDEPMDPTGEPVAAEYVVNAEFLGLPTDVDAPPLVDQLAARLVPGQDPTVRACAIVCFDEDRRNLEAALRLSAALSREGLPVPLFVYLPDETGLAAFLEQRREDETAGTVRAFGSCEVSAGHARLVQSRVVELSHAFHAAYAGAPRVAEEARPAAALAPSFIASNREAAQHVDIKLAAVARHRASGGDHGGLDAGVVFTAAEREMLARMEHNRYVAERLLDGWRYGPRDDVRKRRESLTAWEHLPAGERVKDFEQVDALAGWMQDVDLDVEPQ